MDLFKSRAHCESMNVPLDEHLEIPAPYGTTQLEARWEIEKLLQQLPEKQRLPIVHVKLHGLSIAETARLTGLSESAVKVGVHRGVKAMSEMLRTLS
jgi:RNA polymerase sigma-70 factor (ECF subfamily)